MYIAFSFLLFIIYYYKNCVRIAVLYSLSNWEKKSWSYQLCSLFDTTFLLEKLLPDQSESLERTAWGSPFIGTW